MTCVCHYIALSITRMRPVTKLLRLVLCVQIAVFKLLATCVCGSRPSLRPDRIELIGFVSIYVVLILID